MVAVPEPLLRSIVEVYAPRRIVLFGSRARGDAGPDRDTALDNLNAAVIALAASDAS